MSFLLAEDSFFNLFKNRMPWMISVYNNKDFVTLNQVTAPLISESCLQPQPAPKVSDNRNIQEKRHILSEPIECEHLPWRRNLINPIFFCTNQY